MLELRARWGKRIGIQAGRNAYRKDGECCRLGSGVQESPCAGRVPAGWVEVVGRATPQAWHLVERLECGQETEKSPGAKNIPQGPAQGSLEWWLRAQAEAPSSLGLILASPLTSCVATGQLRPLSCLSVSVRVVGIIPSGHTAAWRISTEMRHLAQGFVQSVG